MVGPEVLEGIYAPIRESMGRVERMLREELAHPNPHVAALVEHALGHGGKRIRPALLLTSAQMCGGVEPVHEALAVVVEMIHHATLIHDDVLDEAERRRHIPTLHRRWGEASSVLLGDYIFARAFQLCARIDDREVNMVLSRAAGEMCVGEMMQTAARGSIQMSEEEYLEVVRCKTASLFAAACVLGMVGWEVSTRLAQALEEFGLGFGMAFQITDDYLDIVGEEEQTGKSLGTDLARGKFTLPVLLLWRRLPPAGRRELEQMLGSPDGLPEKRRQVARWIGEHGIEEEIRERVARLLEQACRGLKEMTDLPAVPSMLAFCDFALNRRS